MRLTLLIVILTYAIGYATAAKAADGFGSYFANQAPSGFSDNAAPNALADSQSPQIPASIANIEPAAGDEDTTVQADETAMEQPERHQIKLEDAIRSSIQ